MTEAGRRRRVDRAFLVAVASPADPPEEVRADLTELGLLVRSAGGRVVGRLCQRRARVDPGFYLGRGKVAELGERLRARGANLVVFLNELSPAQVRNLERALRTRVVDRSELILDIFALRARTRQARVQVELAQLEYLRPRLRRMWTHLERYEGGIGVRGPGEKQLELDRRLVDRRLAELRRALRRIETQKALERQGRRHVFRVTLVGYTNAGKSTLLRRLTGARAYAAPLLFATLDTKTRIWPLRATRPVVVSDTVGFLRRLPHHLMASFHATLRETAEADLLLHVVDAAHLRAVDQARVVREVLREVGAGAVPVLTVLNKADRIRDPDRWVLLREAFPGHVAVSARTGEGLETLAEAVRARVDADAVEQELVVPPADGRLWAFLARKAVLLEEEPRPEGVRVRVRLRPEAAAELQALAHPAPRAPAPPGGGGDRGSRSPGR